MIIVSGDDYLFLFTILETISEFIDIVCLDNTECMSLSGVIKSVNFHITSKCNYHCRFCYTQHLNPDVISFDNAVSIMDRLRESDIDKINFVGGEPLMHPHFFRIAKRASDLGFTVCMTSNASL